MKILKKRHVGHHTKKTTMKLCILDGNLETSEKENDEIVGEKISKVFNRIANVNWEHLANADQNSIVSEIGNDDSYEELFDATNKSRWHKYPGINGISPNGIKSLNDEKCVYYLNSYVIGCIMKISLMNIGETQDFFLYLKREIFMILMIGEESIF